MINNKISISVIIPVYNMQVELFNRAINSIKFNCEIIIVNDGSDPEYNYICPGAKFINLEKNVGHLHARRIGVENATGDWILFLDSDDEFTDNAIESIRKVMDNKSIDSADFIQFGMNVSSFHTNLRDKLDDFLSNKTGVISPYVTNKLWRYECLRTSTEPFENYPDVRLGEDHLIMVNAIFIAHSCINVTDSIYIRHEPRACKKLNVDASLGMKISTFRSMQVFRDSVTRLMNELGLTDIRKSFKDLAFRLSTCRIPMTQDFIDYLNRNGYSMEGLKPVKKVKYLDPNELHDYFMHETNYCSNCIQFNRESGNCKYGSVSDMVYACINHECRYRETDTEECDIHDYFKVSKDTDLISISDEVTNSNYICRYCRYWNYDMHCCIQHNTDSMDALVSASCKEFDDRWHGSKSFTHDFDKLNLYSKCLTCRYHNCGAPFCNPENQECNMYES